MVTNKFYCGVGSRQTPPKVLTSMTDMAKTLENLGYTLRSGGAGGADTAFQEGVDECAQIWLPWSSFSIELQKKYPKHTYRVVSEKDEEAMNSVDTFHPNGPLLKRPVRLLMARNFRQCCGKVLPNSEFVICWTKDGNDTGGTGQAIRIARSLNIPVYNFYNMSPQNILDKALKS